MVRVLAFRHVPFEHLGLIAPELEKHGIRFDYIDLWRNPDIDPPVADADGLIFMGGPMSVNDNLDWLRREERFIAQAVSRQKPVLGICLGAQLVAKALGARVYQNNVKEIGWREVWWTEEGWRDPLLSGIPSPQPVFHWHGETFDLPAGAELLAYSSDCRNQAFRVGNNVYGLQFHLEVTAEMISCWCEEDANEGDMREITEPVDPRLHSASTASLSSQIFGRWCRLIAGDRAACAG